MSEFDTFAEEFVVPSLAEHFGERDAKGNLAAVVYQPPGGQAVELRGVIIGRLRVTDEIEDTHATHVLDQIEDVVELQVPVAQDFGRFEPKTESLLTIHSLPGEPFTLLEVLGVSGSMAQVRCSRKHITRIQQKASERN